MSLEAEVGSIGGEEDGVVGMGECADPKECKMVADLGIDFLAAGIGNIHGKYPAELERPELRNSGCYPAADRRYAARTSRWYRNPGRYDQESDRPWCIQDQR